MKRRNFFKTAGVAGAAFLNVSQPEKFNLKEPAGTNKVGSMDAWAEINLGNIAWNVTQLKKIVKVPLMAVVKANAYGHGLVDVSRSLKKDGVNWLMVGKLEEAVRLREAGIRCSILNFGSFSRKDCEEIVGRNISQSIASDEVLYLEEVASKMGRKAKVHVDLDTGMGRTGVRFDRAWPLLEKVNRLSHLEVEGISTTLVEDREFDEIQLKRLLDVYTQAKDRGISLGLRHAASSAGILEDPKFHLDMVRPGITLYGYYPSPQTQKEDALALKPALRLLAKVTDIRILAAGETLSYHRVFAAREAMRAATVGIGYSDGYPSQLVDKASVLIKKKQYPVIAAVTSNHMMIDLGANQEIKIGDEVVLIDTDRTSGLTADILGKQSAISDYKLLIGLNPLLPREYIA